MKKVTTLTETRFFQWIEDDKSVTIRSKSGSYGGGSEAFIVEEYAEASAPMITKARTDSM